MPSAFSMLALPARSAECSCVAAAASVEAVKNEIRGAIKFHLDCLKEDGHRIPPPTSIAAYAVA
jgi:predicted RNase H-like HicB family nuclease